MTKNNILKITVPSAVALVAATIFCGAYYSSNEKISIDDYPDVIGHTQYCTHSIEQEYTEPTVIPGKYYLNGDIGSCYLDVTENTWQLMPGETLDFEDLYGLENHWSDEAPADPASASDADTALTDGRIKVKESTFAHYSDAHEYKVVTWHPFDVIWLCPGPGPDLDSEASADDVLQPCPQSYWQDGVGYPGPVLKDEKTIQTYGGDYILVE